MPAKAGIRSSQNIMPTFLNAMWLPWHGLHVNPPEILEQWGNFVSWEHIVGTGAYMIKEYAPGSYISYAKNPNYWAMDPVFPGYKLPYADELIRAESLRTVRDPTGSVPYRPGGLDPRSSR